MAGIWSECIHPGLLRGHNVLVFDGPGQQSQLFGRQSSFRPDWEHVLSPVLDTTLALDGIDADRVWVYGVSEGGFWVARALAFEHRFAAAVTDPGVVDVSTSWMQHLPARLRHLLERGDVQEFDKEMALGMRFSPTRPEHGVSAPDPTVPPATPRRSEPCVPTTWRRSPTRSPHRC